MDVVETPHSEPSLPPGIPDGWVYDHDLPCPNCGYNLRMRRTPWCPECGRAYTWQHLLDLSCMRCGAPLARETGERCPQCSLPLDWAALIDGVNPTDVQLFEYSSRPIRSALATFRRALLPRRFWERQVLEMKPNTRRLRGMLVFVLMFYGMICVLPYVLLGIYVSTEITVADISAASSAVCLPLVTFVMLPAFGPTLKICRIRREQILRVAAYGMTGIYWSSLSCLGLLILAGAIDIVIYLLDLAWFVAYLSAELAWCWGLDPGFAADYLTAVVLSLCSVAVFTLFQTVWWWAFLWHALRHFLRLSPRDARALFFSTQLIGALIIAVLAIRYTGFSECIWPLLRLF